MEKALTDPDDLDPKIVLKPKNQLLNKSSSYFTLFFFSFIPFSVPFHHPLFCAMGDIRIGSPELKVSQR